jgi:hypothetical protein
MRKTKKKNMGGQMANPPAASFLEPPMEQPFAQQGMQNPAEFTAKKGGVKKKRLGGSKEMKDLRKKQREDRKKARQDRRADRKADRKAVRTLKKSSRKTRKAEPFVDGAGPIVEMTKDQKRADRKATRKASRMFKKQERKARRTSRKNLRTSQKTTRQNLRETEKKNLENLTTSKLNKLNKSESSSVKTKPVVTVKNKPVETKKVDTKKKVETKKTTSLDDMSFGQAFAKARKDHGGKGGTFTWKGKKYHTGLKSEMKKKEEKKNNNTTDKKSNDIKGGKDVDGDGLNDDITGTTSQNRPKVSVSKTKKNNKSTGKKNKTIHQQSLEISGVTGYHGKMRKGGYKRRGGRR